MIQEITKDINVLMQVSRSYMKSDKDVITDLIDTAEHHKDRCCGLAAVQISKPICAFVIKVDDVFTPVTDPIILKRSPETYIAEEGCMSLDGTRQVKRHVWIDVLYYTPAGKKVSRRLTGFIAEIFQHEYNHLKGVLI